MDNFKLGIYLGLKLDERVAPHPLLYSFDPLFYLSIIYLASVYVIAPLYMRNRKPYELKKTIYWYNVFQIVSNALILFEFIRCGWNLNFYYKCIHSLHFEPYQTTCLFRTFSGLLMIKFSDYLETIFFILRKKNNQVSFLHVFHHLFTPLIGWMGIRYANDMVFQILGPAFINCFIHVLMYTYYLMAAMGFKQLRGFKQFLTTIQLVQFFINFWLCYFVPKNCIMGKQAALMLLYIGLPFNFMLTVLFTNFYIKAYLSKKKSN